MQIVQLANREKMEQDDFLKEVKEREFPTEALQKAEKKGGTEEIYVLEEEEVKAVALLLPLKNRKASIRCLVVRPEERRRGYGKKLLQFLCRECSRRFDTLYGFSHGEEGVEFYKACGFVNSHMETDATYLKRMLDSQIDVKKVVDMAMEAGRILLKNGAEIFRVEETITRICRHFDVETVEIFTLSHAIFVSAEDGMNQTYTKVQQVPLSSPHLGIVTEVNSLSRKIEAGEIELFQAVEILKEIDRMPPKKSYFQILAAGMGSGFFGYLLGASQVESLIAGGIGALLYVWVLFSRKHRISKIITNIAGGMIITTLALLAGQIPLPFSIRLEGMIIGAIMPLVPGLAFVNAIREIADSDFLAGTVRMIDALLVFVYIAVGVGITLSAYSKMMGGVGL